MCSFTFKTRSQVFCGLVERVLDVVKGVRLPGQAVVVAGRAVVVVHVQRGAVLLNVADVHPPAPSWRRRVAGVASVNHRRTILGMVIVGRRAGVHEQGIQAYVPSFLSLYS